jgi:uncharacterized membrane protein
MRRLTGQGLLLVGFLYPFAVYFGKDSVTPRHLALLLGAIWLLRCAFARPGHRLVCVPALAFCALVASIDTPALLRWYPVLVNAAMLVTFAWSLRFGMPVVERLARLREPALPPRGVAYTRKVTQAWVIFFLLNGGIAAVLTVSAPLSWWTLYNGVIAYVLMALLFIGEWLVRGRIRGAP